MDTIKRWGTEPFGDLKTNCFEKKIFLLRAAKEKGIGLTQKKALSLILRKRASGDQP
ncbi:MAG: hypothetical protein QME27_06515 [Syntrophaceae bacterium]|nr:hypothetical protein [Syntrophaceae bacterium]